MIELHDWWPDDSDVRRIAREFFVADAADLAEMIKDARDVWSYRSKLPFPKVGSLKALRDALDVLANSNAALSDSSIRLRVMLSIAPSNEDYDGYSDARNEVTEAFDNARDAISKATALAKRGIDRQTPGSRRRFAGVRVAQMLRDYWATLPNVEPEQSIKFNIPPALAGRSPAWYCASNTSYAVLFVQECMSTFTKVSARTLGKWELDSTPELLFDFVATEGKPEDED